MDEKRTAGILGNRAIVKALEQKFADADGIVRCVSCGRADTTWHHVVPIEVGGADIMSNVVPVCNDCHIAIHAQKSLQERMACKRAKVGHMGGRKRSVPDNYKDLLNDYVFCRIGKKGLSAKWGVKITSRKDPTKQIPVDMVKLTDKVWYKEYLRDLGIEKVENRVDFLISFRTARTKIAHGDYVGTIFYTDGRSVDLYRGINDKMA